MSIKTVSVSIICLIAAFGAGYVVGRSRGDLEQIRSDAVELAQTIRSQRNHVAILQGKLDRLKSDNPRIISAAGTPAATKPLASLTLGVPHYEVQRAILSNLRLIAAARDQFQSENKRSPDSVRELVGPNRYVKRLRTIGGEDYSTLSFVAGQPLTVTTPDGTTVTYDPDGPGSTRIEVPPAQARVEELGRKIESAREDAVAAFRIANQGRDPADEWSLTPYFSSAEGGADFVEYLEAKKIAEKGP
jgi:hypothetical protein